VLDQMLSDREREEELGVWLAFSQMTGPGFGIKRTKLLYDRFGSLRSLWRASAAEVREIASDLINFEAAQIFKEKKKELDPDKLLGAVSKAGIRAYYHYDPDYPPLLREIHDPPFVIFVKGGLLTSDMRHTVAVVGTRRPSNYGAKHAKAIGRGLAESGATVISGMAVGVDSHAHWGAIDGGGRTLAVLGCGVDFCYPSSNKPLYQKLAEGDHGALLSEFFPGTKPEPWRFPARNRIISGLSQAVAVIEAGETSGSLITAKIAFEQNREVYALPGSVDNPASKGTNKLIADNVAHLFGSYSDIIKQMGWLTVPAGHEVPTMVELYGREREIFEMISAEPVHFDVLCEKSGMNSGELSATLTMLELAGVVNRLPGDWYEREKCVSEIG
jgi:DNA processing protein